MKRRIKLKRGDVARVAIAMNCTREMASAALNFRKESRLARRIRLVAKEKFGGVEVVN